MKNIMIKKYSVCSLDCPDTCRLEVTLNGIGEICKVTGDSNHPITKGLICNKVRHLSERVYHSDRVLTPLKRVGNKGEGKFTEISWDEAIDEIYYQFQKCISEYGSESILPYSYAGTMGVINNSSMDRRFFHKLGASRLERTICSSAGSAGYAFTMGSNIGINPEDTHLAEFIIVWGTNLISTNIHQWKYIDQARKKGAKVIVIDIHRNKTANLADQFIQIRPGTDGALALGMINVIIEENLYDLDFINNNTVGFDKLKDKVKDYTLEKVSNITGISINDIVTLAREYSSNKRSFIRIGNGLQHHYNGGMATRIITCLPAITGAWNYKGCGAIKSNSEYFKINKKQLELLDLDKNQSRIINMNQLGDALTVLDNPRIHALFVYNSNPVTVAPDQNAIRTGLLRDDLFTVVHDIFITDTAKYADIILPAPTSLEYIDIYRSYWHLYLQFSEPVIPLQGESLQNTEVFRKLAKKFNFSDEWFKDTDEDLIMQALDTIFDNMSGFELYKKLQEKKYIKVVDDMTCFINHQKLKTTSGKIEFESIVMEEKGYSSVPEYMDIYKLTSEDTQKYPLILVNPPNYMFLNSSFANISNLQKIEKQPILEMNPKDARKRNITENALVTVYNSKGSCQLRVKITDDVLENTVVSLGLWWNDAYESDGNLNQLVNQDLSDMGKGPVYFSTFVEVANTKAVIILGHGSKNEDSAREQLQLINLLKKNMTEYTVKSAYLQLCEPTIDKVIEQLLSEGYKQIVIVPLLLFAGNHVQHDIPQLIEKYRQQYTNVDFILTKHLGADDKLARIVMDRISDINC
jgi:anaerobic selenocysteine-containing dehydrogenase